jgi:hypothetical protein
MGTVDVARFGSEKLKVQQGVNRGLEMAMMLGPTAATGTIEDEAEAQAGSGSTATGTGFVRCGTSTTEYSWGTACSSGQETRKFIRLSLTKTFYPTFVMGTLARSTLASGGTITMTATGVVRVT